MSESKTCKRQEATLDRTTFVTSREMDFFSKKELTTQTGHSIEEWPLVFLKETLDNALDACEEADIAPIVSVVADAKGISVHDNGPGIPDSTIEGVLDFTVRASNREAYVGPDRGAQGNALMTLVTMPYVVDAEQGRLVITAHGTENRIVCRADPVTQRPVIKNERNESRASKDGTRIAISWGTSVDMDGEVVWPFDDLHPTEFPAAIELLRGYALFNPHLSLSVKWFEQALSYEATEPNWLKWKPNKPTSPHWYGIAHLERLIAAYIGHDRDGESDRTVADFLAEFDGLTGSRKRKVVLDETGLARVHLSELANGDGLRRDTIENLLDSMKKHTRIVKARRLGVIGQDHLAHRFEELGCDPKQFEYSKVAREDDGIPFVLESAFSWRGDDADDRRHIYAGANWSAAIKNPFRSFGETGVGLEAELTELRAGAREPIVFALHLAHPRVEYTDRGKSAIVIGH